MLPHLKIIARFVIISAFFLPGLWTVLSLEVSISTVFDTTFKKKIVSATTHYGILGQKAPELDLTTWIDGFGNPIEPIHLKHLREKVVYLYFFQDW